MRFLEGTGYPDEFEYAELAEPAAGLTGLSAEPAAKRAESAAMLTGPAGGLAAAAAEPKRPAELPGLADFAGLACARIRDGERRQQVREELMNHMEDKAEYLLARGTPPSEIPALILADMGDPEPVAGQLGLVHSRVPKEDMRSSLSKLFWGLFLTFFNLDIWHWKWITSAAGTLLLFAALYQLRQSGPRLKKAYRIYIVMLLFTNGLKILSAFPGAAGLLSGFPTVLGYVLLIWCYFNLFSGLAALSEPVPGSTPLQPGGGLTGSNISRCAPLYLAVTLLAGLSVAGLGLLLFIPVLGIFIYILYQVMRLQELFWLRGVDGGAKSLGGRGRIFTAIWAALTFAAPLASSYYVAVETPPAAVFNPGAEVNATQAQAAALLREELPALGLDEALLADLPDAEVLALEGTEKVHMSYAYESAAGGEIVITFAACLKKDREMRLITSALWEQPPDVCYRDGLLPDDSGNRLLWMEEKGTRTWSLYDREGVTYRMPVLRQEERTGWGAPGIEFRLLPASAGERQRVYYCGSYLYGSESLPAPIAYYIHRESFFSLPFQSSAQQASGPGLFDPVRRGFRQFYYSGWFGDMTPGDWTPGGVNGPAGGGQ